MLTLVIHYVGFDSLHYCILIYNLQKVFFFLKFIIYMFSLLLSVVCVFLCKYSESNEKLYTEYT